MEVQEVRFWWCAADSRLRERLGQRRLPTRSSGSPQRPSASSEEACSPTEYPDGCRPIPPSMHTAKELFCVGRTFKLLLGKPPRLTRAWIVVKHKPLSCQFKQRDYQQERVRSMPWRTFEWYVIAYRVRWTNSIHAIRPRQRRHARSSK